MAATVQDVLGPGRRRVFWTLRMASLGAYAVFAAFGHYGVTTILACEGVTMACVLALWIIASVRRTPAAGSIVLALAASIVAGCTRAMPERVTGRVGSIRPRSTISYRSRPSCCSTRRSSGGRARCDAPATKTHGEQSQCSAVSAVRGRSAT